MGPRSGLNGRKGISWTPGVSNKECCEVGFKKGVVEMVVPSVEKPKVRLCCL